MFKRTRPADPIEQLGEELRLLRAELTSLRLVFVALLAQRTRDESRTDKAKGLTGNGSV